MPEKIHNSRTEAFAACREYQERLYALQEEMGVWEENEDSCCSVFVYAKYKDEEGNIKQICGS